MSILLPKPAAEDADRPGSLRMLTRLALSQSLRELVDMSLPLIPTFGEEGLKPGSYARVIRRIGVAYKRVRVLSVLNERIVLDASWPVIDHCLGLPSGRSEQVFGDMEQRWRAGDAAPWSPLFDAMEPIELDAFPVDLGNPARTAAELDAYCRLHIAKDPHDRGMRGAPVTAGLPR